MAKTRSWPHKNGAEDILERQGRLRPLLGDDADLLFEPPVSFEALGRFQECVTSHTVLPVGIVGPLDVNMGLYHLGEDGDIVEDARQDEGVFVPLAHTEGGLSASMLRGSRAATKDGPVRTYVLADRITRDSCFTFDDVGTAIAFSRFVQNHVKAMATWLHDSANPLRHQVLSTGMPVLSRHTLLHEVRPYIVGTTCHVRYRFTTGDACGPNMMTRSAFALNQEYLLPRWLGEGHPSPQHVALEANMGGDKKPSHAFFEEGHGKTVMAEAFVSSSTLRRNLQTTAEDMIALQETGLHGAHASGMQSFAFTPASAVAAIFAATGQDLGMVGTSSMAHASITAVEDGLNLSLRLPGLEVGTVGGGTTLPHARAHLKLMGCVGRGKVYRLAQIVVAAALCLELSASASMASHGSLNFFEAHLERGGERPPMEV